MKRNSKHGIDSSLVLVALVCIGCSPLSAFALTAGAGTIALAITWLQGIGVGICTIAIMWAAFKIMFQGARINDVAPVFIGGILFGSAALIASAVIST